MRAARIVESRQPIQSSVATMAGLGTEWGTRRQEPFLPGSTSRRPGSPSWPGVCYGECTYERPPESGRYEGMRTAASGCATNAKADSSE